MDKPRKIIERLKNEFDYKYIIYGSFWTLFAQAISSLSALLITVYLSHHLNKSAFGNYKFVISVVSVVAMFALPGTSILITKLIAQKQKLNLNKILKSKLLHGLAGSAILLFATLFFYIKKDYGIASALIPLVFVLPFIETSSIYGYILKGYKNFKEANLILSYSKILQLAFVLTPLIFFDISWSIVAFIYLTSFTAIQMLFSVPILKKHNDASGSFIQPQHGRKLTLSVAINTLLSNSDKLLAWLLLGPQALATYFIATFIPIEASRFLNFIPQIALPKLSEKHKDLKTTNLTKNILLLTLVLFVLSAIATAIAPYFIKLLFPQYSFSIVYLPVFLLPVLYPINHLIQQFFISQNKINEVTKLNIISLTTMILISVVFIKWIGISAIVFAVIAKEVTAISYGYLVVRN